MISHELGSVNTEFLGNTCTEDLIRRLRMMCESLPGETMRHSQPKEDSVREARRREMNLELRYAEAQKVVSGDRKDLPQCLIMCT